MNQKYDSFLDLVIYQIYPKSFCDSNGDGIGDIKGIVSKLDYINELGANAIWLCPCYPSPGYDNGYDISDFRNIAKELGTLEDIKELIYEMHVRDMKLFLDLVPNHTSSEHEWFLESRKSKEGKYADYYYWADEPLNDWRSCFGGSAWQFDEPRGQYYLHSYAVEQPDLNWTNSEVVKEMQAIVDYWVSLGVDGFRCDVIDQISKDFDGENMLGPHLHEYINALFGRENTAHLFTVGECWVSGLEETRNHIAPDRCELSTIFNFDHIHIGRERMNKFQPKKESLSALREIIVPTQIMYQEEGFLHSLFTDNHDQPPFISRAADVKNHRYEAASCIASMIYLMRGVPFIFEGQEFGTVSSVYTDISYFRDVESINYYKEFSDNGCSEAEAIAKINFGSRDNARRPVAWNGNSGHGFTTATPWIPFGTESEKINLEADKKSEKSVFEFYRELFSLRKKSKALRRGDFREISKNEDKFFMFERTLGKETYTIVCNFEEKQKIDLQHDIGELVLKNYKERTGYEPKFRPYEVAVFRK